MTDKPATERLMTPISVPLEQKEKPELVRIVEMMSEDMRWYVDERNRLIAENAALRSERDALRDGYARLSTKMITVGADSYEQGMAAVRQAETERCAKIADMYDVMKPELTSGYIADRIRAAAPSGDALPQELAGATPTHGAGEMADEEKAIPCAAPATKSDALTALKAEVRFAEAKWWHYLHTVLPHCGSIDCDKCERIAELRALTAPPAEQEGSGVTS